MYTVCWKPHKIIIIKVRERGDWEATPPSPCHPFPSSNITSATSKLPSGTHSFCVRLFSLLSHTGVRSQFSSSFQPQLHPCAHPSTLQSHVVGPHMRAESSRASATKARDPPQRQHCSAMLAEKGWSPSPYLARSQWQRLRRTCH